MSTLFVTLLVAHVFFGVFGVILSFSTSFMFIKDTWDRSKVLRTSFGAWLAYMVSWFTGGWYYWKYYGTKVKPIIINGDYSWAHSLFTEAKEHVFLFLPIVSFTLMCVLYFGSDALRADADLKKRALLLSFVVTALGFIVTLSGVLITGGAR